jgi:hypothetical protein
MHCRYDKLLQGNILGKPLSLERIVTLRSIQLTSGPSAGLDHGDRVYKWDAHTVRSMLL